MIVTSQELKEQYSSYSDYKGKIARDIKSLKIFPLKKGIYENNSNTYGARIGHFLCGPSYLSFDFVLSNENLIPEGLFKTFTYATFNKKNIKKYRNHFGQFIFRNIPKEVFFYGVEECVRDGYTYNVATREKALCDKLYIMPPVRSIKEIEFMLFENLRIDEFLFDELDKKFIIKIAPLYRSTNLNLLEKYLRKNYENSI